MFLLTFDDLASPVNLCVMELLKKKKTILKVGSSDTGTSVQTPEQIMNQ